MELHFDSNNVIDLIKKRIVFCKEELAEIQDKQRAWLKENERYALFIFDRFKNDAIKNKYNDDYDVNARMKYYQRMLPSSCYIKREEASDYDSFVRWHNSFTPEEEKPISFKWITTKTTFMYSSYTTDIYFIMSMPSVAHKHPWISKLEILLHRTPPNIKITLTEEEYNFIKDDKEGYFNMNYLNQSERYYSFSRF
jgi:hypothetical protein